MDQGRPIKDTSQDSFAAEQRKDTSLREIVDYLERGTLPSNTDRSRKLLLQSTRFQILDGIIYFIDPRQRNHQRAVVPIQLRQQVLKDVHSGSYGGHFSGQRLYNTLATKWWWEWMLSDAKKYAASCPECAIVAGNGRTTRPPLHPIPVSRPFQILGIDVMDLPLTENGNRHVVVIQDLFTKWPMVYPVPDQKSTRIARLIAEEVVPMWGVPECLLSDRGTNLLSNLMMDLCRMLGITKLNTTAYHPQCDGAVERFNRTLKTILRKHASKFGCQWDRFLPGILWAYRNTPHSATGEKPSFLLYGVDCRSPTEAAYLPTDEVTPSDLEDYREELMMSLTSARGLAANSIQRSQQQYKKQYDKKTRERQPRIGSWVLIYFPQDESGRYRKLSRPWHGPYRVTSKTDPDVTCVKVYHPQEGPVHVHQSRVCPCPEDFPAGFYWYGGKWKGPGRPPKWVDRLLESGSLDKPNHSTDVDNAPDSAPVLDTGHLDAVDVTQSRANSQDSGDHSTEQSTNKPLGTALLSDASTQQDYVDPEQPTPTSRPSIWEGTTPTEKRHRDQIWNADNFLVEGDASHMDSYPQADDSEDQQLNMDTEEDRTSREELDGNPQQKQPSQERYSKKKTTTGLPRDETSSHQQGAISTMEEDVGTNWHEPVEEERGHVSNEEVRRDLKRPRDSRLRQRITPPQRLY